MTWTVDDIPEQSGRTVLITGATAGTGLGAACVLAERHVHIILACRNSEKMAAVASDLRAAGARGVDELVCDKSDLNSVRLCAKAQAAMGRDIDVQLLNAGMAGSYPPTAQGYEMQVGTNHLGHFLLAGLLMPVIRGRIVAVSSAAHFRAKSINCHRFRQSAEPRQLSAILRVEACQLLNRRLRAARSKVLAVGAHAGITASDRRWVASALIENIIAQPTAHSACPLLLTAIDENAVGAAYYGPSRRWFEVKRCSPPISTAVKNKVLSDVQLAIECWRQSEKLTGFTLERKKGILEERAGNRPDYASVR